MDFRLLGPFEVHLDGRQPVSARRSSGSSLGLLALEPDCAVPVERLIDLDLARTSAPVGAWRDPGARLRHGRRAADR
jgi:hypothetical protein